ncbi:Inhibitor of sigma-G Gin [Desulforamulus aeronauticus DSM 10349]|uniref:Inhibitor of sigma-G Gin n=2 Tax=Desulforamulus aeronauticus TaxID=53343 RepID=A0A1M6RN84_9FIRM|nr:Inhibitor of sigma-G Gin [Desulforamulus aeronauticus DSM 10349]
MMKEAIKCVFCCSSIEEKNFGIVILGKYICADCERKITHLTGDDPNYDVYQGGLKRIWFNEA